MIPLQLLQQAIDENTPNVVWEQLCACDWVYPTPPGLSRAVFARYEAFFLAHGLHRSKRAWFKQLFSTPDVSWKTVAEKLLHNCVPMFSSNPQWISVLANTDCSVEDFAARLVEHDNAALLECLLKNPRTPIDELLHRRLFKDSMRKKSQHCFRYLYKHLKNKDNPQVLGAVIQQCLYFHFDTGLRWIFSTTSPNLCKKVYKSNPDFKTLTVLKNSFGNESLLVLLNEGHLRDHVRKAQWLLATRKYLSELFALHMSGIFILRSSVPLQTLEENLFSHPHWEGQRMPWIVSTLLAAPQTFAIENTDRFRIDYLNKLIGQTSAKERFDWWENHVDHRQNPRLKVLCAHPMMQNTILTHEVGQNSMLLPKKPRKI